MFGFRKYSHENFDKSSKRLKFQEVIDIHQKGNYWHFFIRRTFFKYLEEQQKV